jgi:hypothetical protein
MFLLDCILAILSAISFLDRSSLKNGDYHFRDTIHQQFYDEGPYPDYSAGPNPWLDEPWEDWHDC